MITPRILRLTPIAIAGLVLPGCIVNDIHEELQGVNTQMAEIQQDLDAVKEVNRQLDDMTNERLVLLDSIADSLDSVEQSLVSIDGSLKSIDGDLGPVQESLSNVDGHLASLRKTINNIDSTIPFLKVSGDSDDEAGELEAVETEQEATEPESGPESAAEPGDDPAAQPETTSGSGTNSGTGAQEPGR